MKKSNALLGLAVSALSLRFGETRTYTEMQYFIEAAGERISRDKQLAEALSLLKK